MHKQKFVISAVFSGFVSRDYDFWYFFRDDVVNQKEQSKFSIKHTSFGIDFPNNHFPN